VSGRWERLSQRVVLQLSRKITYYLRAGDGRDGVSVLLCSYRARSHTYCGPAMGATESAGCCAAIEHDHVQTAGGQWEKWSQWIVRQLSSKIAYPLLPLLTDDGSNGVSVLLCSYRARSRTSCGRQMMGATKSVCCCAAIEHDHVHPVGG